MAFGTLVEDAQGTPIPQTYVPGVGFIALKGSTTTNTDGSSNTSTAISLVVEPQTSGGTTGFHRISTADANAVNIKASAGQVYGWDIANNNAAWRYVKLHNNAGAPTAGAGVIRTIGVPPNGKANYFNNAGIPFATGIAMTAVTGAADSDTTAVGASELTIDIDYK